MSAKLIFQAVLKYTVGLVVVGALLFIPAGTFAFTRAWVFLALLFVPMLAAGIVMTVKSPALLKKRLDAKEEQTEQKALVAFSALMFTAAFVCAGLDFRFGWIALPTWTCVAASVVFAAAYALYAEVLRENEYLSRTVGVQEDQKVIDTGLYGVVRHPMYMSTVFLFLSMPIVLGSVVSFGIMLFYIPIIVMRIRNEERVLEAGLRGYAEYKKRVKYRLIPFVW